MSEKESNFGKFFFDIKLPANIIEPGRFNDPILNYEQKYVANKILDRARNATPVVPNDCLLFGDNWKSYVGPSFDITVNADHGQATIMPREMDEDFIWEMRTIKAGVKNDLIDPIALHKIALLDFSETKKPIKLNMLVDLEDELWGARGFLPASQPMTWIYAISRKFADESIKDFPIHHIVNKN